MHKTAAQIAMNVLEKEAGLGNRMAQAWNKWRMAREAVAQKGALELAVLKQQRAAQAAKHQAQLDEILNPEIAAAKRRAAAGAAPGKTDAADVTVGQEPAVKVEGSKGGLSGAKGIALATGLGLGGGYLLSNSNPPPPQDPSYLPPGYTSGLA